jgi:hypothetical protein
MNLQQMEVVKRVVSYGSYSTSFCYMYKERYADFVAKCKSNSGTHSADPCDLKKYSYVSDSDYLDINQQPDPKLHLLFTDKDISRTSINNKGVCLKMSTKSLD